MPSVEILLAFTAAALVLNISPGPSNFYVMARVLAQGSRAGLVAALGLSLGGLIHVFATVLGLAALFQHFPLLYLAVKLVGAAYLVYLGIRLWVSSKNIASASVNAARPKPLWSVFYESVVVEVTNPKTALFFIALLPQFVVPESGSVTLQLFILGLIVVVSALPCDMLVAISAGAVSKWFLENRRVQIIQQRISGTILCLLGAYIVADEIRNPGN